MSYANLLRYLIIVLFLLLLGIASNNAWAETATPPAETAVSATEQLYQQAVQLHQAGQLDQAIAAYTRMIEHDPRHAKAYLGRALIYNTQKQYDLAIADLRQVIALNPENAGAYGVLGWILTLEGHFDEARTMTQKAHQFSPKAFSWAINLGHLYLLAGDGKTARQYYLKGLDHIETEQQFEEGPVADFKLFIEKGWQVAVMQRELAWIQQVYPVRQRWKSLNREAIARYQAGDYRKAEASVREALAVAESTFGAEHPDTTINLNNLAVVLDAQGRYGEAELLYRRALAIYEQVRGAEHPDTATSLNNLAEVLRNQSRYGEAEPLARRALAIHEKVLGAEHPTTALSFNNLAVALDDQGRSGEAEPLYRRALAIHEKVLGAEHPTTALSFNNLAAVLQAQGRTGAAEPLYRQAVIVAQKAEEPDNLLKEPDNLLFSSRNLGFFLVQRGRLQDAVPYYRTTIDTLDRLFAYTQGLSEEARQTFLGQYAYVYREFIDLLLKLHEQDPKAGYDREVLAVASRNQSRIFRELLRQADVQKFSAEPTFVELKSRREALQQQLTFLTEKLAKLPLKEATAEPQRAESQRLSDQLATVEQQLWRDYPRFMELVQPQPVAVEQLQQHLLRPDEALLSLVLLKDRTVLLAVTRERFTLRTVAATEKEITERVGKIREPLEQTSKLDKLDPKALYQLYQDLIAPVEDTLHAAKRVLVVAEGPLYNLPLELLVTAYGESEQRVSRRARQSGDGRSAKQPRLSEYATLPYLADRYRFSYLPSLAALVSQRTYLKPPVPMTRNLIAFADPLFSQEDSPGSEATKDYSAATEATRQLLTRSGALTSGDSFPRLRESAEEARTIADLLGDDKGLYLRDQAQERTVKTLNTQGQFQGLHYLLFSTHGLLGGEFLPPASPSDSPALARLEPVAPVRPKPGEPALVLTLVDPAPDDGFLTMSEVLGLNLNTDLVVLSACNTAGEKANQGEGFVGLTRSFLYAGTRHLLVSHWKVASNAARDLMIATFTRLKQGQPPLEALAESRRQVRGQTWQQAPAVYVSLAHPYFWAPFVVVGD